MIAVHFASVQLGKKHKSLIFVLEKCDTFILKRNIKHLSLATTFCQFLGHMVYVDKI